jgi:hypothetical protein
VLEVLGVPFLACLVLTGIHVYLGLHVLARGVISQEQIGTDEARRSPCPLSSGRSADHRPWIQGFRGEGPITGP